MFSLVFLVACTPDEAPTPVVPEDDPAWIDPWEPVEVDYDQALTEASLQVAVDTAIELRATPVIEAYEAVMAQASPMCPNMMYDLEGYSSWVDSCATTEGVQFSGYAFTESGFVDLVTYTTIAMSATVSGGINGFSGSGYWGESTFEEGEVRFWGSYLEGQVLWEGPGPDSWITQGVRPSIEIERSRYGDVPFTFIGMRGAVGGLDAPMQTAEFIDVVIEEPFCDEPFGTISVRDDGGHWFDVSFDGEDCNGCGVVTHLGEEVGEACVDFTSWTTWEPTP